MSVTFWYPSCPEEEWERGCASSEHVLILSNCNAAELLRWLGYGREAGGYEDAEIDFCGELDPSDLRARCARRLWPESRNEDPGVPLERDGNLIDCGRRAGSLSAKAALLLRVAEHAAEHGESVSWG